MRLCASWVDESGQSAFVILINFSNVAISKQKLRPSERQEHRIPNLRKAPDVACNANFNNHLNRSFENGSTYFVNRPDQLFWTDPYFKKRKITF